MGCTSAARFVACVGPRASRKYLLVGRLSSRQNVRASTRMLICGGTPRRRRERSRDHSFKTVFLTERAMCHSEWMAGAHTVSLVMPVLLLAIDWWNGEQIRWMAAWLTLDWQALVVGVVEITRVIALMLLSCELELFSCWLVWFGTVSPWLHCWCSFSRDSLIYD